MITEPADAEGWQPEVDELRLRRAQADALGGAAAVEKHHGQGRLTVRERIGGLVDADSFQEVGRLTGQGKYAEDGKLLGVISFRDVAKAVLEEQDFENKMLKGYIKNWPA